MIECDQTENLFRTEMMRSGIRFDRGESFLPEGPGLGVEINREALQRFASP
jgi:D-galactarolactone cycloisomerase